MELKKIAKHSKFIIPTLSFLALSLVFVGGSFSPNTHIEKVASYAAEVTKNNTTNKQFCCLTAETRSGGSLPDSETEFRNLYGSFAQRKISFASVLNPDKEHSITISNDLTPNLSALYVGPVGSTVYKDSDNNEHIKHYIYPIELMFENDSDYEKKASSKYYAYISQSQADVVLDNFFHEKRNDDGHYPIESYKKLILETDIPFSVDGASFDFSILNIYYETNYYYLGLKDVVGDFIMISYSFPNNLVKERKNLYFLNDNSYQNEYYMKYIREVYNSDDHIIKINHYNLVDSIDDEYLLSFFTLKGAFSAEWLTAIILSISGLILIACLGLILYVKTVVREANYLLYILSVVFSLLPYLLFKLLFTLTNDVRFLSEISAKTNSAFVIIYISSIILIAILAKPIKLKPFKRLEATYYEVYI